MTLNLSLAVGPSAFARRGRSRRPGTCACCLSRRLSHKGCAHQPPVRALRRLSRRVRVRGTPRPGPSCSSASPDFQDRVKRTVRGSISGCVCTHAGCLLSDGWIEGDAVECSCHGSMFDRQTGEAIQPPAQEAVPVYEIRVEGGEVQIARPQTERPPNEPSRTSRRGEANSVGVDTGAFVRRIVLRSAQRRPGGALGPHHGSAALPGMLEQARRVSAALAQCFPS
jgi:hypothetical protein